MYTTVGVIPCTRFQIIRTMLLSAASLNLLQNFINSFFKRWPALFFLLCPSSWANGLCKYLLTKVKEQADEICDQN